jgi:hypothetical protein
MAVTKKKGVEIFTKKPVTAGKKLDEGKLDAMIKERAYYLWEEKGKPQGCDMEIWIQAKKEIMAKNK